MRPSEIKLCSTGDRIRIGRMQDSEGSRTSQESRDILWRILAIRGEMALVLSEQLLEVMPFHFKEGSPSWEYCSLRTWLNTDFLLSAFTPEERETIVRTPLEENVRDWIFLLSMEELEKYTSREDVLCKNGIYRKADAIAAPVPWKTVKNEKSIGNYWWLRSVGKSDPRFGGFAVHIDSSGNYGQSPVYIERWVRPAMWVKLNYLSAKRVISKESFTKTASASDLNRKNGQKKASQKPDRYAPGFVDWFDPNLNKRSLLRSRMRPHEYFKDILQKEFPNYSFAENVRAEAIDPSADRRNPPVDFIVMKQRRPALAIFLFGSDKRPDRNRKLVEQLEQKGIPSIWFYTSLPNYEFYVIDRIRTALEG